MAPTVTDDMVWVPELEMALEFQGTWATQVLPPPPFTLMRAQCRDAPIEMEVYALDPEEFRHVDSVGRDLVHSRLAEVSAERYTSTPRGVDVNAAGVEQGRAVEIAAFVTRDNDVYYVMAFSAPPGVLEEQLWRVEGMAASATYGHHASFGTGLKGLVNLVGAQLAEPRVVMGQSRAQLGPRKGPPPLPPPIPPTPIPPLPKVVVDPALLEPQPPARRPNATPLGSEDLLSDFDAQLQASAPDPGWPASGDPRPGDPSPGAIKPGQPGFAALKFAPRAEAGVEPPARDPSRVRSVADRDELAEFEARLQESLGKPAPLPVEGPRWPAPWEALPSVRPQHGLAPRTRAPLALTAVAQRERRVQEIVDFAESLPAQVGFHAEKIFGVGEHLSHREDEPFGVMGLDRLPIALEAVLQARQGDLNFQEHLDVDAPRRAWSRLGRQAPEGSAVLLDEVLVAMSRDDDDTAADMMGWRLGWRQVQSRLPAFGLHRHSILIPSRARMLAMTDLEGPLEGMDLQARVDLWRQLSEDERRQVIGQLHVQHLETPLDRIAEAFLGAAQDRSIPWALKAQWALALGPRGCAREYAGLMAALMRGEVLGPPHQDKALGLFKPCVGDHLSGLVPGVDLGVGKLGQTFGALCGAGVLLKMRGSEVAICVLAKQIQTEDHAALAEELRVLSARLYMVISD